MLPATSVHVPLTEALPLSGPLKVVDVHEAIPEVASLPVKDTVTGALYQPLPFGARSGELPVTVGASLSILNWRWKRHARGAVRCGAVERVRARVEGLDHRAARVGGARDLDLRGHVADVPAAVAGSARADRVGDRRAGGERRPDGDRGDGREARERGGEPVHGRATRNASRRNVALAATSVSSARAARVTSRRSSPAVASARRGSSGSSRPACSGAAT